MYLTIKKSVALLPGRSVAAVASSAQTKGIRLFTQIENLLDEKYQKVGAFGAPDLSGFAGVRTRFQREC